MTVTFKINPRSLDDVLIAFIRFEQHAKATGTRLIGNPIIVGHHQATITARFEK